MDMMIENLSTLKFPKFFLDSNLLYSLTCNVLDHTKVHQEVEAYIAAVLEYISNNSGFTVLGWYKLGDIVNVSKHAKEKMKK